MTRTVTQFGILAPLIPIAFIATALRRPRYALLTGTAVAITCFFAASYVNADISRYYLGPALMAWTWLAILAAAAVELLAGLAGDPGDAAYAADASDEAYVADEADAIDESGPATTWTPTALIALVVAVALLVPTLLELPQRHAAVDASHQVEAADWTAHALDVMEPNAAIVSWWSYSTPLWYAQRVQGQRPDIAIIDDRTRLDENLGSLTDVIDANLGKRPVYVIRLDPNEIRLLADRYELEYIDGRDARTLTRVLGLQGLVADALRSLARAALALGVDVERVDEIAEDVEARIDHLLAGLLEGRTLLALVVDDAGIAAQRRLLEDRLGGVDGHRGADRQGERIRWPGIDLDRPAVALEQDPGVEGLVGELADDHPVDARAQFLERRREQVVGQRALGGQPLELHRDGARLPRPDPDGQVAVAGLLLEDDHVAAGEHMDPDALDDHLDQPVVHRPIIPRPAGLPTGASARRA